MFGENGLRSKRVKGQLFSVGKGNDSSVSVRLISRVLFFFSFQDCRPRSRTPNRSLLTQICSSSKISCSSWKKRFRISRAKSRLSSNIRQHPFQLLQPRKPIRHRLKAKPLKPRPKQNCKSQSHRNDPSMNWTPRLHNAARPPTAE